MKEFAPRSSPVPNIWSPREKPAVCRRHEKENRKSGEVRPEGRQSRRRSYRERPSAAEVLSGIAAGEGPGSSTAVWRRKRGFPLDIILTHNHGIMIGRVEAKRVLGW
ncbi:MAG: hypothetical protein C6P37_16675 [Caldibacillus debilis]|uniref:Uncharacterized protein n=1 Tax=Caldibacillus debilis TaxID=301148 RepID=A0A3E0JUQ6_9BACI|nr:MAG: hypothetical protein C6W57_03420 [Caldibacillus debilis]REJ22572.1 MAG: hypothetical protein C6W56_16065 [Caldibacillus debilis]REJ23796.1 MAG: hypothetical protein C6P37_16675 [Caldibacillus debilis]